MKKLSVLLLLGSALLPSCATSHAIRYSYGKSSFYQEAETDDVWRAVYGTPLVIGSIGWDVITLPVQIVFGVWPMWGSSSLSMDPETME
jgi:hypothetical protein